MLALRRWLDDGGIAGLLADRTLARQLAALEGDRRCPSSARRRSFPTGRSASRRCCAGRSSSWPGLYRGGNRYELRFVELADFRPRRRSGRRQRDATGDPRGAASAMSRRSRRCAARRRTTGSTSTTSGPTPMRRPADAASPERSPRWCAHAAPAALAGAAWRSPRGAPRRRRSTSAQLMTLLGTGASRARRPSSRRARVAMLDRTLESSGRLSLRGARHSSCARRSSRATRSSRSTATR